MSSAPTTILGIDPGGSGGLAVVSSLGGAWAIKMPATERDVWQAIRELVDTYRVTHATADALLIAEYGVRQVEGRKALA